MSWPLVLPRDNGIRPAGPIDKCFYCRQKVGQPHGAGCVMVRKKMKLRYIIEVDVLVPYHWQQSDVEFHRNESSWCADNCIDDIVNHTATIDENGIGDGPCLCDRFECEFVADIEGGPIQDPEQTQEQWDRQNDIRNITTQHERN